MELVALTTEPLDVAALTERVAATAAQKGAIVSFLGIVRGETQGRAVRCLEYEAYEPLARRILAQIVEEVGRHWPDVGLGVQHRLGRLAVGEASVAIVAAAPHRADAFAACRYVIERIKQVAPIWKKEVFDGGEVWIEGAVADPADEAARREAYARSCA
jgi:molybdopterin synthase catalytic subunit